MAEENIKKLIGEVFNEIADSIESGKFGRRIKVGLTTLGSEYGTEELVKAAHLAKVKYPDVNVVLIGPKADDTFETYEASSDEECYMVMEKLIDDGTIQCAVTMHYNFPVGVATVGKVITPGSGKEMYIATTTGTSSVCRVESMFRNAIYGIIAAKAMGIENPSLGILNVDGARQVERALKELTANGYTINFAGSVREDGGSVMRGNDILSGTPDVMVTDTLTGNLLVKMLSSFTTGGSYESLGYGYGPGIGEGYKRIICIVSRASGAPVIREALNFAAALAKNNLLEVEKREFAAVKNAGYNDILKKLAAPGRKVQDNDVEMPPKKVVTHSIAGIDILELEDAVKELWKNNIYSESGMGCTGPIILVSEGDSKEAKGVLVKSGYISE